MIGISVNRPLNTSTPSIIIPTRSISICEQANLLQLTEQAQSYTKFLFITSLDTEPIIAVGCTLE